MAASTYFDQVQQLYIAYFGRPADPIGQAYWANQIDAANGSIASVIAGFSASTESAALFGNKSSIDKVTAIYQNAFGRAPEPAGLAYWVAQLDSGKVSQAQASWTIQQSAGPGDAAAVQNKLTAAKAFTAQIDTTAEIQGYQGSAAAESARGFLAAVTQDNATATAAVNGAAAAVAAAAVGVAGSTFTLTASVGEQINGTASNDTVKAVLAATAAASTFNTGDIIDGKAGTDTFELIVEGATALPAGAQVSNVEKIVVTNGATSLATLDAAQFAGATDIVIKNNATAINVSNIDGLKLGVQGDAITKVTGTYAATTAQADLVLTGAKGAVDLVGAGVKTLNISGSSQLVNNAAQTVVVGGTATAAATTVNVAATAALKLDVSAAVAATKVNVTGIGSADLGTLGNAVKTVDASANTGGVTFVGGATAGTSAQEVTGGTGNDSVTLGAALADKGFVKTGAGNDKVVLGANAVAKGATVDLGAGNDSIVGTGVIDKDAVINGGEGIDTLALELVGASNIGAFTNFEIFDVAAMTAKTLDLDILASKNTVTNITGTAALAGAVTLSNLGAGVNFEATKDMGATALTLTQKAAGALTVTLNADSTSTSVANDAAVKVVASNASSLKAVFDNNSGFVQTPGVGATENNAAINLTGTKAATLEVVSGGSNATNALIYSIGAADTTKDGLLTSVTVSGSQALSLDFDTTAIVGGSSNQNKLATVDASALTGSLSFDLADLANKGVLKLGSGADVIKAGGATATAADIESIVGFSKSASATDADKIKLADKLDFTTDATVGTEATASAALDVAKGVVTFLGTGPTTLDAAIALVDAAVTTAGAAVAFQYLNNSYIFQQNAANDVVVQLSGVTSIAELGVTGAGADVFIV